MSISIRQGFVSNLANVCEFRTTNGKRFGQEFARKSEELTHWFYTLQPCIRAGGTRLSAFCSILSSRSRFSPCLHWPRRSQPWPRISNFNLVQFPEFDFGLQISKLKFGGAWWRFQIPNFPQCPKKFIKLEQKMTFFFKKTHMLLEKMSLKNRRKFDEFLLKYWGLSGTK